MPPEFSHTTFDNISKDYHLATCSLGRGGRIRDPYVRCCGEGRLVMGVPLPIGPSSGSPYKTIWINNFNKLYLMTFVNT